MKFLGLLALGALAVSCNEVSTRPVDNTGKVITGAEGGNGVIRSQLSRVRGTAILSSQDEIANASKLPTGYDDIPDLNNSDDGRGATTPVVRASRPSSDCGLTAGLETLRARIADCASKNPNQNEWIASDNGTAGEGNWRLVAKGSSKEIWLDETTGLIWSDALSGTSNWCQASGNNEAPLAPATIDCNVIGAGASRCEGAALLGIPASEISWRLPTRSDFLQADVDGARYVLPNLTGPFWTATVSGEDRDKAWAIAQSAGVLSLAGRDSTLSVRCIGRRLK